MCASNLGSILRQADWIASYFSVQLNNLVLITSKSGSKNRLPVALTLEAAILLFRRKTINIEFVVFNFFHSYCFYVHKNHCELCEPYSTVTYMSTQHNIRFEYFQITDMVFDDGSYFATSTDRGTIRLWNSDTFELAVQFQVRFLLKSASFKNYK